MHWKKIGFIPVVMPCKWPLSPRLKFHLEQSTLQLSFNLGFLAAVNQAPSHKAIKPVFKVIFEFSCCSSKCFICYIIASDEDYVSIAPLFFF